MFKYPTKNKLLAVDAIPFHGGSKVATKSILDQLIEQGVEVTLLTEDPASWVSSDITLFHLPKMPLFWRSETGFSYYAKHLWISVFLFISWIRCGKPLSVLGTSGPGVDLSIYLTSSLLGKRLRPLQFIHGPVGESRTNARCLLRAKLVAYLESSRPSMESTLKRLISENQINALFDNTKYQLLINGISQKKWPSKTQNTFESPSIFWAASLLKWKGLDELCTALSFFPDINTPNSVICYINPKDTDLPVCNIPHACQNMEIYEAPTNLNLLRSCCNIFVSTSHQEPFGLSILEAMAAGLCIVIPNDGAYWDTVLIDNVNCIKYKAHNETDLFQKLDYLRSNMHIAKKLASRSVLCALDYQAELKYASICEQIISHCDPFVLGSRQNNSARAIR